MQFNCVRAWNLISKSCMHPCGNDQQWVTFQKKKKKKKAVTWHSSLCLIRLNVAWQIVFLRLFYLTVRAPAGTTVCWPTGWGTTASDFINVLDGKGLQFCVINAYNLQKKKKVLCILLKWPSDVIHSLLSYAHMCWNIRRKQKHHYPEVTATGLFVRVWLNTS